MLRHALLLVPMMLVACAEPPPLPGPVSAPAGGPYAGEWVSADPVGAHNASVIRLVLRPDGTCTWTESALAAGEPRTVANGTWTPAAPGSALVTLEGLHLFPVVRLYTRGKARGFDTVAYRRGKLDPRDNPVEWLQVRPGLWACTRDLPVYSDETPIPRLAPTLPATHDEAFPPALVSAMRKALPTGWSLTRAGDAVLIARDRPVLVINTINMSSGMDAPQIPTRYTLTLRRINGSTQADVDRLAAHNGKIEEQIKALQPRLRMIDHKFDDYLPRTTEEKLLVAQYEELRASFLPLPTHRFGHDRWYHADDSVGFGLSASESDELDSVRAAVLSGLTPIDAAKTATR